MIWANERKNFYGRTKLILKGKMKNEGKNKKCNKLM